MQRMTKQRQAIWQLLSNEDAFLSAQDVHDMLVRDGYNIGLATVYRNLQALVAAGDVDVLRQESSDTQLFRFCAGAQHHHHLVCRLCGTTVEITGEEVESWADSIAAHHGFSLVSHSFEIFGVCEKCAKDLPDDNHR